jgi:hypothetical protein
MAPLTTAMCPMCGEAAPSLAHLDVEKVNMALVTRDHPEWRREDGTCPACLSYYEDLGPDVGPEDLG